MKTREKPLTHDERRKLIETPIVVTVHGQSYRSSGVNLDRGKLRATKVTPDTDYYSNDY